MKIHVYLKYKKQEEVKGIKMFKSLSYEKEKKHQFPFTTTTHTNTAGHQMCGFFFTPTNSPMPAGCPTTWFCSDSIYMELASDPTG